MKIVIRTDSSTLIGSGHMMRCLTLADELRQRGAEVMFVCREHPGHMIGLIEGKGYPVVRLLKAEVEYIVSPEDVAHAAWLGVSWKKDAADTIAAMGDIRADWLIIDNYALDCRWEETLRPLVGKIMVIDDLADRPHGCDLLLDQNLYEGMESRYLGLVPNACSLLLGPRYALLRSEFVEAHRTLRVRDGNVSNMLVFFGGSDPSNETEKALLAIEKLDLPNIAVDVVVGASNPAAERIRKICQAMTCVTFHHQVDTMASLMARSDLALGAGGATTWERCYLGLPALVWVVADNQLETTLALARRSIVRYLGWYRQVAVDDIVMAVRELLKDSSMLRMMYDNAVELMGKESDGVCQVVSLMQNRDGK